MYDRTCERQRKRRTTLASSNQQHRVRMMVPRWSCVGTLLLLLLALQKPECCRRDGTSSQHSSTFFFACALETATDYEDDVDARQQAANSTSLRRGGGGDGLGEEGHKPIRPESSKERLTMNEILLRAGKRGLGGGIPGALAGVMQVVSLMWLRTIVNYQSRYGTTFSQALTTLMKEGGIRRLYRGIGFALIQAPLARFVSTAANDGIQSLLSHLRFTADWGPGRTTAVASLVVGLWRIFLMRKLCPTLSFLLVNHDSQFLSFSL